MHMEHTIAKDAFSGLSGNNAVYNAICIAVCDDEQFMCDMIEENSSGNKSFRGSIYRLELTDNILCLACSLCSYSKIFIQ